MKLGNIHATAFKTWWVQQPMSEAFEIREKLKTELQWSDQQWWSRLNSIHPFTQAEKTVIESLTSFKFSNENEKIPG